MTVNRTTLLDLPLPVTGTESGTWGDTTNNGLTQYLDIAIAGTLVLSTDADVTLTSTEGDSSATNIGATTAQYAILRWTATGSTTRNITALAQSKTYVVINATGGTQSIVLRGAGPTTGVTIISGEKALCVWNGSDFVKVSSSAAAGGSNTQVQYNSSGVLAGSSNLTFDGTSLTLGGNPTLSAGTANGVLYLNGSKVATSGSALTFDGTRFVVGSTDSVSTLTATFTKGKSDPNFTLGFRNGSGATANTEQAALSFDYGSTQIASIGFVRGGGANAEAITFGLGSEQMRLTSTGLKSSIAGTNADPVFSYTSDTNTGIFFPAADKLGFTAGGGTDQMVLTTTGLGIGTSSPGAKLDVSGEIRNSSSANASPNTQARLTAYRDGSNWGYIAYGSDASMRIVYSSAAGSYPLYFGTSTATDNTGTFSTKMTLDASGNLGIGVTSPGAKLDLAAETGAGVTAVLIRSAAANANGFQIVTDSTNDNVYLNNYYNAALRFGTNNTERARITSGGYFKASNDGTYNNSTGSYHELRQTANITSVVIEATNASFNDVVTSVYAARNTTNNSFYAIGYYNTGGAAWRFYVADSGNVTNTNGTYGTISDAKMKTDIVDAGSQWADIKAIRFRKFKMKDDPSGLLQLGVVAQELEQTSPGLVEEHADRDAEGNDLGTTTKSVKTSILLMKAAKALQEAMARIETLEAKVSALEGN